MWNLIEELDKIQKNLETKNEQNQSQTLNG